MVKSSSLKYHFPVLLWFLWLWELRVCISSYWLCCGFDLSAGIGKCGFFWGSMINLLCSLGAVILHLGSLFFNCQIWVLDLIFFSTVNFCDFEFSPSRAMYLQITGAAREREKKPSSDMRCHLEEFNLFQPIFFLINPVSNSLNMLKMGKGSRWFLDYKNSVLGYDFIDSYP